MACKLSNADMVCTTASIITYLCSYTYIHTCTYTHIVLTCRYLLLMGVSMSVIEFQAGEFDGITTRPPERYTLYTHANVSHNCTLA